MVIDSTRNQARPCAGTKDEDRGLLSGLTVVMTKETRQRGPDLSIVSECSRKQEREALCRGGKAQGTSLEVTTELGCDRNQALEKWR